MDRKTKNDLFATVFPMVRRIEQLFGRCCHENGISGGSRSRILGFLIGESSKRDVYQKDVEHMFQIRPSSASALLQALENEGLVTRTKIAGDARLKKIVLTEKSLPEQQKHIALQEKCQEKLLEDIDPQDLEVFYRVCDKIYQNASGKK